MNHEAAFLDAMRAAPDDDAIRLLFSDWLDAEAGESERAAAVREGADPAVLEVRLYAAWQRRDFPAWELARKRYAAELRLVGSPLWPMAAAECRMTACTSNLKDGGKRPWLWRLAFRLPGGEIGSRWWRNRRMNAAPLLGFPRAVLRCMGTDDFADVDLDGVWFRFTAMFKPRADTHTVQRYKGVLANAVETRPVAFDADVHPAGFAACFWDKNHPESWDGPRPVSLTRPLFPPT